MAKRFGMYFGSPENEEGLIPGNIYFEDATGTFLVNEIGLPVPMPAPHEYMRIKTSSMNHSVLNKKFSFQYIKPRSHWSHLIFAKIVFARYKPEYTYYCIVDWFKPRLFVSPYSAEIEENEPLSALFLYGIREQYSHKSEEWFRSEEWRNVLYKRLFE